MAESIEKDDRNSPKGRTLMEGEALSFFKMSRKSETASSLKALISDKLLHFLDEYSDDVLAEYITVLVCNGKNEYQAREDLEAFLGEQSGEFVSWLWELLLKDFSRLKEESLGSDSKLAVDLRSHGHGTDKDTRSDRSRDFKHNIADHSRVVMAKFAKNSEPSATTRTNAPRENVRRHSISRGTSAIESYICNSNAYSHSRKISSTVVPAYGEHETMAADKSKKTVHNNCSELHHQLLHLPMREPGLRNPQSAPSGRVIPAEPADVVPHQKEKPQLSVWDRLGNLHDASSVGSKRPQMPGIVGAEGDIEVLHQHVHTFPVQNSKHSRRSGRGVPAVGNRCDSFRSHTSSILEGGIILGPEPHVAYNIKRKRHFGEISANTDSVSIDLGGNNNISLQCKEPSQDSKKQNLIAYESATTKLVSEVSDVKQKLQQIEMEMSKLRSKQLEKVKYGKLQHQQEDVESRTVYIANVHFAATKEAISLYFAKCGVVENVTILTDQATCQPKGAAFVIFTTKESADKAISLTGTAFYSRIVKVVRKTEVALGKSAATATATSSQFAGKISQASLHGIKKNALTGKYKYFSPHLQWHRESTPTAATTTAAKTPPLILSNQKPQH